MPGEELTLMPATLELFAYQGKDLGVWFFFPELWLFSLSHSSLAAKRNLMKSLVLRAFLTFLHIEMLAKQRVVPLIPLPLQVRRKQGKAAEHDSTWWHAKILTCLSQLPQWMLMSSPNLAHCPGDGKGSWGWASWLDESVVWSLHTHLHWGSL